VVVHNHGDRVSASTRPENEKIIPVKQSAAIQIVSGQDDPRAHRSARDEIICPRMSEVARRDRLPLQMKAKQSRL
jgi:hypothetical protein